LLFPGLGGRDPWTEQAGWLGKGAARWHTTADLTGKEQRLLGCHSFLSVFVGCANRRGAFAYVPLGRVSILSLCSGPQRSLGFPPTTGAPRGTGSCEWPPAPGPPWTLEGLLSPHHVSPGCPCSDSCFRWTSAEAVFSCPSSGACAHRQGDNAGHVLPAGAVGRGQASKDGKHLGSNDENLPRE